MAEFDSLPKDMQASLGRIAFLIRDNGLEKTGLPYVRHLQDKLWEMRGKGKDGIVRGLYVAVSGRRIVIVRCFIKKTQKTPDSEIKLALQRAREILS
ncbi:MAG: type II toxin-antitoxin system RelE/ParE family toxin [Mailhella sp.]